MGILRLITVCAGFLAASLMSALSPAHAQASVVISVDFAPPPLPLYDQPPIPSAGYIWEPGYWVWSADIGWYWVPGTWVLPPAIGLLWTPAYWAYSGGEYVLHDGYWAPEVGFYGGIDYGFGYAGYGYEGGYWNNGTFFYNTAVNNISNVSITNVYRKLVVDRNRTRISYNGGPGGVRARPTPAQLAVARERHVPATAEQRRHVEAAAKNPAMALAQNHGHPAIAATSRPAQFRGPGIVAAHPGRPIAPVPPTAARAARSGIGSVPTARHGESAAFGQRRLDEPTPSGSHFAGVGPRQAVRPPIEQRSAPVRQFARPMTRGPVVGPHIAGAPAAAPARQLMMTTHPAFRPQPAHPAAAQHFAAPPHFAAPHPAAPPHFAAAAGTTTPCSGTAFCCSAGWRSARRSAREAQIGFQILSYSMVYLIE